LFAAPFRFALAPIVGWQALIEPWSIVSAFQLQTVMDCSFVTPLRFVRARFSQPAQISSKNSEYFQSRLRLVAECDQFCS
jgi:hypothetical protein